MWVRRCYAFASKGHVDLLEDEERWETKQLRTEIAMTRTIVGKIAIADGTAQGSLVKDVLAEPRCASVEEHADS